jgi:hypothetical protein
MSSLLRLAALIPTHLLEPIIKIYRWSRRSFRL